MSMLNIPIPIFYFYFPLLTKYKTYMKASGEVFKEITAYYV